MGNISHAVTVFLDRLLFPNVCLNQSCFPFSFRFFFFFPTVDVVFGRWAVHTSVSSLNGSQPKVGHFSQPFALFEWIPSPLIYPHRERKGPK